MAAKNTKIPWLITQWKLLNFVNLRARVMVWVFRIFIKRTIYKKKDPINGPLFKLDSHLNSKCKGDLILVWAPEADVFRQVRKGKKCTIACGSLKYELSRLSACTLLKMFTLKDWK